MKTLIIGLDGATWSVIDPLMSENIMPNVKRFVNHGVRAVLKSTIPPVTNCAWLSLATGLNPGKTGVIDFFALSSLPLNGRIASSLPFKGRMFWDLLSEKGFSCVILDYPSLISIYDLPSGVIVTSFKGSLKATPKCVEEELLKIVEDYDIIVDYHDRKYDDFNLFIKDVNKAIEKKRKVTNYLK